ncbi:hypothetical protein BGZ70_007288 [Mortierella alpina]|uniref:F-box domain-containing protein n=1 Tax=Mortierella alpina TaxID=64518 RepID=A0A9P6J6G6_MORAP|nr:hypothetical protein BGZ70_007288 [Mortierella alpina]
MGVAIDFAMESHSATRRQNAILIPELAFQIQLYMQPEDLAVASRVSKAWQEAWAPFLYYSVQYRHHQRGLHSRHSSQCQISPKDLVLLHSTLQEQQHCPPFLNLEKYGAWIKHLEVSNLFVAHQPISPPSSSGAVSPGSSSAAGVTAGAAAEAGSAAARSPPSSVPLIQDHLAQIQTCSNMRLTLLDISRTVMSLDRLDDLLSALPWLKVFKFEVMNKIEPIASSGSHSRNSSTGSLSGVGRGFMMQQPSHLLKKPKRLSLEGLESEVVRVIARRLHQSLERLDLALAVTGGIALPAFQELFESCGSTLKSLALTKVEICQHDCSRAGNAAYQAEIAALLASLLSSSPPSSTAQHLQASGVLSPSSSYASISTSSSFSSDLSMADPVVPTALALDHSSDAGTQAATLPPPIPALESISFNACFIPGRECEIFLRHAPGLRELHLHDCRNLDRSIVKSILTHTPLLETLSLNSVPNLRPECLQQLFETTEVPKSNRASGSQYSGIVGTTVISSTAEETTVARIGLRLKNVRLAYLRQLDDTIMETLATHQGASLLKLSIHWCPHVTDEGILPIFRSCEKLEDLSLCLSKPTLNIFKDLSETTETAGQERKLWACAQTLERLEIGGQMFVDRLRTSNEHLHPQLYHHLSPNPHHIRNRSGSGSGLAMSPAAGGISTSANSSISLSNSSSQSSSSIIHDPYSVAHHQGYPMYHLWRYHRFSDPFRELQAQLETLPRLKHLGIPAKGIEHLIAKGFGAKVQIQSLALLNQQGRVWSADEIRDLLQHMPHLRRLFCEKNTVLSSASCSLVSRDVMAQKRQMEMMRVLRDHRVELVQSSSSASPTCY